MAGGEDFKKESTFMQYSLMVNLFSYFLPTACFPFREGFKAIYI